MISSLFKGQNGALPGPVGSTASFARSRSRQRVYVILGSLLAAFVLTHQASRTSYGKEFWESRGMIWPGDRMIDDGPVWRPDLEFDQDGNLKEGTEEYAPVEMTDGIHAHLPYDGPKLEPQPVPDHPPPSTYKPDLIKVDLEDVPTRERKGPLWIHDFPSALDDDPWPERPEIVSDYLRSDLESKEPSLPFWPAEQDIKTHPLDKKLQVPFSKLFMPKDYQKPPLPIHRKTLPKIQFDFANGPKETEDHRLERERRREWVRTAMIHAWNGYKEHAWGHDEVRPVTRLPFDAFNGWGATIIDAMDTLLLMNMSHEYDYARTHVQALDFTLLSGTSSAYGGMDGVTLPTFETTIRYLGGLLGAYDVSGDSLMLEKARELGDWIIGSFNTKTGMPIGRYRLGDDPKGGISGRVILSEAGSMSLEYTRLWQATGETAYYDVIQRATDFFDTGFESPTRLGRLLPSSLLPESPTAVSGTHSFAGQCDSYYEYLIKEHLLLGGATDQYARMYAEAMDSAYDYIIRDVDIVPGEKLLTVGEYTYNAFRASLDHLTCFAGAMMGIGAKLLDRPKDMETAEKFSYTCFWAYNVTATGIGPESLTFYQDKDIDKYQVQIDQNNERYRELRGDPIGTRPTWNMGYGGRPETIESVFYMYRITGDPVWQDRAWQMFVNWVRHTITPTGFAGLVHVGAALPNQKDTQESFVFAETLKYYYLAFCDHDFLSLDDWVFNTEAHPFRLRPEEELVRPVSNWQGPNLDVNRRYLEPAHGDTMGRGTSAQRVWRAAHARIPAPTSSSGPLRVPVPLAQAFNGGVEEPVAGDRI